MLAYRAVPVRFLFSLYVICWWVRASLYFLARPKSMMYTKLPFFPRPLQFEKWENRQSESGFTYDQRPIETLLKSRSMRP